MKKKNRPQAKEAQAMKIQQACSNNIVVSFYCDECMSKFYCSKSEHKLTVHDRNNLGQPIPKKKGGKKGEEKREKKKKKEEEEEDGGKKKKKIKKKEDRKMFHCSFCKQPRYFHTQNALNHHICNKHAA